MHSTHRLYGFTADDEWDCDRRSHVSPQPAHMSPSSVLVAEQGDWRLMRSTLARGYYATHPRHGWYLLRAVDDRAAREEFSKLTNRGRNGDR